MLKKKNIIKSILISLTFILTINITYVYATVGGGNEYELDSNNANTNTNSNSKKPSVPKPKPPTTEQWYDKINWDYKNNSNSWIDDNGRLIIYYDQATKDRTSTTEKDWHWIFNYASEEGATQTKIDEKYGAKTITFIAPADGFYYIQSTPRVHSVKYWYSRNMTTKYWLKEDEDGTYMVSKFIGRTGEVPTKTISKEEDIEQTYLTKNWKIFLKAGQPFEPNFSTVIVETKENIDTNSVLVK